MPESRYVVNTDPIDGEGYTVHTDWCAARPDEENQIFLGRFPDCWHAIAQAKALDIEAHACVQCCKECRVEGL